MSVQVLQSLSAGLLLLLQLVIGSGAKSSDLANLHGQPLNLADQNRNGLL